MDSHIEEDTAGNLYIINGRRLRIAGGDFDDLLLADAASGNGLLDSLEVMVEAAVEANLIFLAGFLDYIQNLFDFIYIVIDWFFTKNMGHPDNPLYPIEAELLAREASRLDKALEINNSSPAARPGSEPICRELLLAAKKYKTLLSVGSDAHYHLKVGCFDYSLGLLQEMEIPEEQVVNSSMLCCSLAFAAEPAEGVQILKFDRPAGVASMPATFRTAQSDFKRAKNDVYPSRTGLDDLRLSGSSFFSKNEFKKLLTALPAEKKDLVVLDLRNESHDRRQLCCVHHQEAESFGL